MNDLIESMQGIMFRGNLIENLKTITTFLVFFRIPDPLLVLETLLRALSIKFPFKQKDIQMKKYPKSIHSLILATIPLTGNQIHIYTFKKIPLFVNIDISLKISV